MCPALDRAYQYHLRMKQYGVKNEPLPLTKREIQEIALHLCGHAVKRIENLFGLRVMEI